MADDTDEKADLAKLSKREDFPGWRESMKLYALEKGDVDGIFTDDGSGTQDKICPKFDGMMERIIWSNYLRRTVTAVTIRVR